MWGQIAAGAASGLAGGLLSGGGGDGIDVSENYRLNKALNQVKMEDTAELYRQHFLNASKQAQAAGYHPLYALGNTPQFGSPVAIGGQSDSGSLVGDTIAGGINAAAQSHLNKPSAQQAALTAAQTRNLAMQAEEHRANAQATDFATASHAASVVGRGAQNAVAQQDAVKIIAAENTARNRGDTSRTAGAKAGFDQLEVAPSTFMNWPANSPMTADELTSPGTIITLLKNLGMLNFDLSDPREMSRRTNMQNRKEGRIKGYTNFGWQNLKGNR